ncbi:valine--tRNA ligase [Phytoactinopolyspora halotolerans]|uniref:Valine--tRNA ligase n=1 Tax=Phytoactinopolyspora halotolerans TaxID=1981512 RepID=A0A6L9SCE5_9ACTN|nr:valine--tRNA ligase [Phytoactinopolyspora halotolerans]NEE01680.1 valine--tRNA ligase [Phytoactinopolyspora halotolerans]
MPDHTPDKPTLDGLEETWSERWEQCGTYRFDHAAGRDEVYSIDTPPPTASGELHVGHVFSYTHTDIVARYQRMRGRAVFYPMGWDDNGLPTERRVENYYGVRCDPSLPYDPEFVVDDQAAPPDAGRRGSTSTPKRPVSRKNFIELCERLTARDEQTFEELWRRLGLSVDWSLTYTTIGETARTVSQRAFLRNLARGEAYQAEAPTLWDVTFQTAVAQAELEDRERPGAFHRIAFAGPDGEIHVDTTRPELLPACVALVVHPDDERYTALLGRQARTPLFDVAVPIMAHRLADRDKGTGIAMVCTFGDVTDVTWWRELDLPVRAVIGRDGRMLPEAPDGVPAEAYRVVAGSTVAQARRRVVERLRETGLLVGEPRPITHPVKFYEKGDRPLEIVTSRQWYIGNGGRDSGLRRQMLDRGRELAWVPDYMRHRYEHWVGGLTGDWLISRQRYFGVPIPVWYPLDADGCPRYDEPLSPAEADLPVDPASEAPPGYDESQRGTPGGFVADPDVMDTWATSSLTPQIVCGWERDPDLFARTFPMDLHAQAHEIIRTWLFSCVLRAHLENGSLPWRRVAISGFVVDPDRKKMGKSVGNATTPVGVIERYGADAVRWRAAGARPGRDTPFDEAQMKVGRRLAMKVLNAGRFIRGLADRGATPPGTAEITDPLDLSMLAALGEAMRVATEALDGYDYTTALEAIERFFWTFCDDYLELVKERAYGDEERDGSGEGAASARAALDLALSIQLRLLAPFMPFVTEEVWSWTHDGSVHRAEWPTQDELPAGGDPQVLSAVGAALSAVRGLKNAHRLSMRASLGHVSLRLPDGHVDRIRLAQRDLRAAGRIGELTMTVADDDGETRAELHEEVRD